MEVGIKRWYDDARKWGRGNSAEECKETFESLQDLSSFLKKLEVELHKVKGDSNVILKKFPSVGKLLGQLYENNVVLLSDEVFQIVVRCSLLLSKCSAVQEKNLNKKAKSWVQTQLRCATIPILKNSILHHIGEFWGYTAQESLEIMLKKLVSSMCHDLEVLQGFFWNEEEREFYPQKPISGLCLKELSEFCLPLITIPQAKPLVEKILCSQKSLDLVKSCHNEGFLVSESVPQVLLHAVSLNKGLFLSYDAQVSLWKRHQPSFESEILDLIEISSIKRPFISRDQLRDLISSRRLPRACVENPEFFAVAWGILSSFLARSGGSAQVAKLLSVFGQICVEECQEGRQQVLSTFSEIFPDFCQPLVRKLAFRPRDAADEESVLTNLQNIHLGLEELTRKLSPSELFNVWKILWCFPSWEREALRKLLLRSSKEEMLNCCVNIFCWFHVPPLSDKHSSLKEAVREIVYPMRLLKSKTRLQFADILYILSTCPVLRASEASILLSRLLLVFLCDALGGHLVFTEVVKLFLPEGTAVIRLSFVIDGLENIFDGEESVSSTEQKKARLLFVQEIKCLSDEAKRESLVATLTESESMTQTEELLTRTKTLITVLQTDHI